MANILIVDDERSIRRTLMIALQDWGHETSEAGTGDKALALCGKEIFDVVVTDLVMEKMDGIQLLLLCYGRSLLSSSEGLQGSFCPSHQWT